ncbi:hypothetical protein LPB142_12745 [Rhodobacter xanthinilyticus]|uniref:Oxaloacetate decarboxylase, gamma chain n=1 Tax=Rhodobacter xanthinilyticus TaxID=1850250 RepID=A0A1D9MDY4_9RHOB|nr:OadG family transporter subunit [Rhodobacter xanthinilyticus]AOZ70077.1 hypothetical protein LPB142_12745 [Rhodobacter xanthinilyticus]
MLDNLELIGTGFGVVMAVLAALWAISAGVGALFQRAARPPAPAPAAPVAPVAAPVAAPGGAIPPHHLAAIAAAVAHLIGPGARVTHVAAPAHKVSNWPLEGRIETFTAHRIRTDWGPTRPTLGGETPDILRGKS